MILADRPHLQGLVLGVGMLVVAAPGAPAAVHAAQDLTHMPSTAAKVATQDRVPKHPQGELALAGPQLGVRP